MNKLRETLTNLRAMPLVFRASIVLLAMAGAAGQLTQHRAAGPTSAGLLIAATRACPMAVRVQLGPDALVQVKTGKCHVGYLVMTDPYLAE